MLAAVATCTVLVVEDDQSIREIAAEVLETEGFRVLSCSNGDEALKLITNEASAPVDLLVLDLMLPGLGGLDLCRELRRAGNLIPILVISARDSETDRVLGLEVGADDYLVKPFGLPEFVARCRALLRRARQVSSMPQQVYSHANLSLYVNERRVTSGNSELNLSPKEYKLLELFIQNPRQVWTRDQLLEKIWGDDFVGDSKTVDVHIRWLREKVEEQPSSPQLISTVRGFGYRFG